VPDATSKDALTATYLELIAIVCVCCGKPELAERIKISWQSRFTARMGDARWDHHARVGWVRLSIPLWDKASPEEQEEKVVHEACHIIADYTMGRRQGHNTTWRIMMFCCGFEGPRRCHTVNHVAIRAQLLESRVEAHCACPTPHKISRILASKLHQGAVAVCKQCCQPVRL
jgi:SprT protein